MEQLQILWMARSYATPQSGVKAHTQPYYRMLYVENGTCNLMAGDLHYILQPEQCIAIPLETEHSYFNEMSITTDYPEIKFATDKVISRLYFSTFHIKKVSKK